MTLDSANIICYINIDGAEHPLTTNDITASDLGKAIVNALFTSSDNSISLLYSVDADGGNPTTTTTTTTLTNQGHSLIKLFIEKETSNKQIKIYNGISYWSNADNQQTEHAYQCLTDISMSISSNMDSTPLLFKSGYGRSLKGSFVDCSNESDYQTYFYSINNSTINLYTWVRECDTCSWMKEAIIEDIFNGTITDNYIYFEALAYMSSVGIQLQDSVD